MTKEHIYNYKKINFVFILKNIIFLAGEVN